MRSAKNTTFRVELLLRAILDLEEIYTYIGAQDSTAAAEWFNPLEDLIVSLNRLPDRGTIVKENKTLRQLLHGNKPHIYRVIYAVNPQAQLVSIVHIRHGARQPFKSDELSAN